MKLKLRKEDRTDAYGRRIDPKWDESGADAGGELRRHRRGYEEYFEGYTEKEEINRFGKKVSVRVYTGDLFRPELSCARRRLVKAAYVLCWLLSLALNVGALCLPVWSNRNVWTFALGCLPAIAHFRCLFALYNYLLAGPELKIYEYSKGSRPLTRLVRPAVIASLAAILAAPVGLLIAGQSFAPQELLRMAMLAASAAAVFPIERTESRIEYTFIPGKNS